MLNPGPGSVDIDKIDELEERIRVWYSTHPKFYIHAVNWRFLSYANGSPGSYAVPKGNNYLLARVVLELAKRPELEDRIQRIYFKALRKASAVMSLVSGDERKWSELDYVLFRTIATSFNEDAELTELYWTRRAEIEKQLV